jgi:hypothetical protein
MMAKAELWYKFQNILKSKGINIKITSYFITQDSYHFLGTGGSCL